MSGEFLTGNNAFGALGADCHLAFPSTSSSIWQSGSPLRGNLPLLMIQITVIVFLSKALHFSLRRFSQPVIVSQILTGIILGPSVLGRINFFREEMFPPSSLIQLRTLGILGLAMFMFMIGVKTDTTMVRNSGKKLIAIGLSGQLCALLPVLLAKFIMKNSLPDDLTGNIMDVKNIVYFWSLSPFIVISSLVDELKLLNSKVGRLAISTSLTFDLINLVIDRVLTSIRIGTSLNSSFSAIGSFVSFALLMSFIIVVARPVVVWLIRKTPKGELLDQTYFAALFVLFLVCGLASEIAGHGVEVGMLALGLALPSGPPLGSTLEEKLEGIIMNLGIPVFVANIGISAEVVSVENMSWGYLVFFLVLSFVGKVGGIIAPAFYTSELSFHHALALGLIMASKGIFELRTINYWHNIQMLNPQYSTVVMLYIVVLVGVTTPVIRLLYNPSQQYTTNKRRSVQHTKPHTELRLLACVHHEEHVLPVIEILDSIHGENNPVCVYVLHLVQLVGQAASLLVPYKRSGGNSTSEAIMNVFLNFQKQNPSWISLQPFVSISPYATMHDEICNLALEKKVSMVILPFNNVTSMSGLRESRSQSVRGINFNVLGYSPCSVGILVSGGNTFSSPISRNVAVYFIGGPDDREAVSLAIRMTQDPRLSVTVVRFIPTNQPSNPHDKLLDDEVIADYTTNCVTGDRVAYVEEHVADAETLVEIVRVMSVEFTLLVVGRSEGRECVLTEGMSVWSEYPELGVVGDMLASTEFGSNASTLVVQQQRSVVADVVAVETSTRHGKPYVGRPQTCKPAAYEVLNNEAAER